MDKFNTHQVTMGIKKSIKQQNSKQKRHIAPKSKEFRSWILRKVIDNGKNNSLNIWILDNPKIWGTHLNRREVVMIRNQTTCQLVSHFTMKNFFLRKWSQLSRCGDCLPEISSMILKDSHEKCLINYWEMVVWMGVWLQLKSVWSLPQTKDQFLSSAELCIVFQLHWLILDVPWIIEAK